MWAAGCVMYQLCSLRLPFRGENLPALAAQIQQGYFEPIPSHCGEGLSFLVNNLLVSDPNHRLSADEVLQSKYLKGSQLMTEDSCSAEKRRPVKNEKENMWTNKVMQELNRDYLKDEKSGVLDSDMKKISARTKL
ncbi:serine/threonine-protein kinase Nek3 [Aplysia californica]|uniref:non-specific serine/threonine protein kinase n=1 Tax=Aplysia californica TaxID=6500 RepID=A0ABM1AAH6_APLCA|nr:serine/threonine-protein kinase Nek3 [Aplysia californica]